jgi:hypothetical protein
MFKKDYNGAYLLLAFHMRKRECIVCLWTPLPFPWCPLLSGPFLTWDATTGSCRASFLGWMVLQFRLLLSGCCLDHTLYVLCSCPCFAHKERIRRLSPFPRKQLVGNKRHARTQIQSLKWSPSELPMKGFISPNKLPMTWRGKAQPISSQSCFVFAFALILSLVHSRGWQK